MDWSKQKGDRVGTALQYKSRSRIKYI